MNKKILIIVGVVLVLIASSIYIFSAQNNSTSNVIQSPITSGENSDYQNLPVEPAAAVARKDLAAKLSVDEKSIIILKISEATWNDGCLGLGGPAESCLQALVPGFSVELTSNGKTYIYRTDKTGASVRQEENTGADMPTGKLNIDVICTDALSYMTFPSQVETDTFVSECKEGKRPEVIERYKAQMNISNDAAI